MGRLQFSTRGMLFVVLLVAAFLGYAQWRRQAILRESSSLKSLGFTLLWPDESINPFWPLVPKEAAFEYYQEAGGTFRTTAGVYTEEELNHLYAHACDRLRALGVEDVRIDKDGKPGDSYTSTHRGKSAE